MTAYQAFAFALAMLSTASIVRAQAPPTIHEVALGADFAAAASTLESQGFERLGGPLVVAERARLADGRRASIGLTTNWMFIRNSQTVTLYWVDARAIATGEVENAGPIYRIDLLVEFPTPSRPERPLRSAVRNALRDRLGIERRPDCSSQSDDYARRSWRTEEGYVFGDVGGDQSWSAGALTNCAPPIGISLLRPDAIHAQRPAWMVRISITGREKRGGASLSLPTDSYSVELLAPSILVDEVQRLIPGTTIPYYTGGETTPLDRSLADF